MTDWLTEHEEAIAARISPGEGVLATIRLLGSRAPGQTNEHTRREAGPQSHGSGTQDQIAGLPKALAAESWRPAAAVRFAPDRRRRTMSCETP